MNKPATEVRSVVVERELPFSPEKIWRALTQPQLIEDWLMKNDFKPVVGHGFNLRADWGAVDCKVWTLTPTSAGTHLRMEHSGFQPDQQQAYQGAKFGWQKFFTNLEQVLARQA